MTEQNLEDKLIKDLEIIGYQRVNVKDIDSLNHNLRVKLEQLNDYKFTDEQYNSLCSKWVKGSIFDKAVLLRSGYDLKDEDTGIQKEIIFFNTKEWCKNIFEVTNQIKMQGKHNNRYDVTLLINGFPLVQIELKKPTVSELNPIGQIERYKDDTMSGTLFDFVQLFIISNGNNTLYCANNTGKFKKEFVFNYADFNNNKIFSLAEFTNVFLEPCQLGKFIARYMILSQDPEKSNKQTIMAMRSYQIHAVEKILDTLDGNVKNGYIWHTTGSGKTLTSYKACEIISQRENIDKVLFIVDRQSLDRQTVEEYQKFQSKGSDVIPEITSTKELIDLMNKSSNKLIVTSIQKLERAIKKNKLDTGKKVVLVFDECHRSQLGNMHKRIDEFFNEPFKFGFTGTPILKANAASEGQEYRTTEDVFGEALHKYLINDAIDDKNVLGFHIDYKSVIRPKDLDYDEEVEAIDSKEVLHSLRYITKVSEDIISTYETFTNNRKFNAMLACDGIDQALKYYNYIRGYEQEEKGKVFKREKANLKVACIFSYNVDESAEENKETRREAIEKIIKDYNKDFNTEYTLETYDKFKRNVSKKMKDKEIDLLIVSDMFLTGFDAPRLNTLYFDKEQKYHNLIQSLSRTNRVYGKEKDYGNIISYRPNLEANVDEAIELFSNPNSPTSVLKISYQEQLEILNTAIQVLTGKYPTIDDVLNAKGDEARLDFLTKMRNVNRAINSIITYREFEEKDLVSLTLNDIEEYKVQYKNIYDQMKVDRKRKQESVIDNFEFEIGLLKTVKIDYDYIKKLLIDNIENIPPESIEEAKQKLLNLIKQDPKLQSKLELIERFLSKYFNIDREVDSQYEEYIKVRIKEKVDEFSQKNNLNNEKLVELVEEYDYSNDINSHHYTTLRDNTFNQGVKLTDKRLLRPVIDQFIVDLKTGDIF